MKIVFICHFITSFVLSQLIYVNPNTTNGTSPLTFTQIDQAFAATLGNSTFQNCTFVLNNSSSSFVSMNQSLNISKNVSIMYY